MRVDFDKIFTSQSDQVVTVAFANNLYVLVGRRLLEKAQAVNPPLFLAEARLCEEWGYCGYEQQESCIVEGPIPFQYGRWSVCEDEKLLEENIQSIRSRFFELGVLTTFHGLTTWKESREPLSLTSIQLLMARRLATTYGHLWTELTFFFDESYSEEDIKKKVLRKHGVPIGQEVMSPELDSFGTVVFRGEGVEWRVERDGRTYFQLGESVSLSCDPRGFNSWDIEIELNPSDLESTTEVLSVARNLCNSKGPERDNYE